MKKTLKIIAFRIGVDILGFPDFCKHFLIYAEKTYITILHKKYHQSIKFN